MRGGASTFRGGRGTAARAAAVVLLALAGGVAPAADGPPAAPAVAAPPAPAVRRGPARRFLVHFEDAVRNEGTVPLRDVVCDALLPIPSERQTVRWIRLSPHGWTIRRDAHGQTVATARLARLEPGAVATFSWIASVDLRDETHEPCAADAGAPPEDAARYVGDARPFGLDAEPVRDAAARVAEDAGSTRPLDVVRAAAKHVHAAVAYAREGGWDPAPAVLARGTGSCSESTFAFAAICRRLGVPVRWTGGTRLRPGAPGRTVDTTFHRIAEAWLPGHGWLPVEATGGGGNRDPVGRVPAGFLFLGRGDGTGDAGAGVSYFCRDRWVDSKKARGGRHARRAYWLAGVDDALALRGTRDGLSDGDVPSFPRAELIACDARGFGAPLDDAGRPLAGATAPESASAAEAARALLAAAHPEGIRLLAEVPAADREASADVLRAACDADLAERALGALAKDAAGFEAWWAEACSRIVPDPTPDGRGRLVWRR